MALKDTESTASAVKSDKKASEDKDKDKDKKEPEPTFEILSNPTRVMRQQLKTIQIVESNKYVPLKDITIGGIVVIRNLSPESEELVQPVSGIFLKKNRDQNAAQKLEMSLKFLKKKTPKSLEKKMKTIEPLKSDL